MARIQTYTKDANLSNNDLLLGSDTNNLGATANFALSSLTQFFEENIAIVSATTIFNQNTPATTWSVAHELNKFPSVTVVDSSGNVVIGEILYLSPIALTITFESSFSGKAYLN
tara:strand:- start:2805 stop:3146 length:342 start_codon:yes stop_codon:yes gene_type:complete